MKILITGGAGFVGRHFADHYLKQRDEVWVIDPLVPLTGAVSPLSAHGNDKNLTWIRRDCREWFSSFSAEDTKFDIVIHLAAMVGGREMIEHNPLAVADDLSIDAAFWQWAVKSKPGKIICFSSSAAYPVSLQTSERACVLREDTIDFNNPKFGMPDMTYGWAKLTHEYLARLAHQKHGLDIITYRPFSGYGEDQHEAYPFPSIIKRVFDLSKNGMKNPEIQVWGTGDQVRDFIHIDDVVRGVVLTMDKIHDGSAVNLSTGIGTSFKSFAAMAASHCGFEPSAVVGMSSKPEGVFYRVGDTVLQQNLGFTNGISFNCGIERAVQKLKNSSNGNPA
jgi:GDP-L-fucose synthase